MRSIIFKRCARGVGEVEEPVRKQFTRTGHSVADTQATEDRSTEDYQEMSAVSAQMEEVQNQLDSAAAEVAEKRNSFTYSLQSAFNFSKTSDQNDANVYQTLM